MRQDLFFNLSKYPNCFGRYYILGKGFKVGPPQEKQSSGEKMMAALRLSQQNGLPKPLVVSSCGYGENKQWCQLCKIRRNSIPSLVTSHLLGTGFNEHRRLVTGVLNRLEDIANRHDNQDKQVIELANQLEVAVGKWNLTVIKYERSKVVSTVSTLLDWYHEEWPIYIERLNREIDILISNRKAVWESHRKDEPNIQNALQRAHKIWSNELETAGKITKINAMAKQLSEESPKWTRDGQIIPKKTIAKWFRLWKGTPSGAYRGTLS